jgi:adenosylcobinamide kinase/adenosylcobinamide-phosphate guanylyltransferase
MATVTLIIGGARSGKSRLAEELALSHGPPLAYLATGSAGDAEMAARIARHQSRRGPDWTTIEEPMRLPDTVRGAAARYRVILVDCLTLWISNLLLDYESTYSRDEVPAMVLADVRSLTDVLRQVEVPVVLVSSEVGMGIVPDNRLGRLFRDLAGEANEMVAGVADQVYVCFAGVPLKIKG